ncbi:MAG: hypothetical protein ACI9WU_003341 [Myxococcota bacterium]
MSTHRIQLKKLALAPEKLAYFRYGNIGEQRIVTNDAGDWVLLPEAEFKQLLAGKINQGHPRFETLRDKGFLREGLDIDDLAQRIGRKKRFVGTGPHLHIVITTLRCNQGCRYCHASRTSMDRVDTDMSLETAKHVVDTAMQSTSPYINFEFTGGEPTINLPVIKFIVEYANEKNKQEGKQLDFSCVTNMTWMTEEIADWLIANKVLVCTSLDGPEELHNFNRFWQKSSNAYASVRKWIEYFNQAYIAAGLDPQLWHVDCLMTTTRKSFEFSKEIVDLYEEMGVHTLHLRPLNPYGFALNTWKTIGYTALEYLDFYARTLDYIIERNKAGAEIVEGTASTFLMKMLTPDDPNFVDIRSPCGAGTGQVAYNYDGKIFTCDEARMVSAVGNDFFQIGTLGESTYDEVIQHPTVRAMAVASLQDSLPGCDTCWNKPFCGVCPMANYQDSGDIFGQRPNSAKCKEHYTISSLLLERMADDADGEHERIFRKWILTRPREQSTSCKT